MNEPDISEDEELDAVGLLCPLPVLKARKRLSAMKSKAVLAVLADDPAAVVDIPHFCTEQGHRLLHQRPEATGIRFFIEKK